MFQMKSVEMVHWDFWQRLTVPLDAQIVTIIGPNGSGKTTLLDAMRTLLAIKCSGKRDYKRYVRNNKEPFAYLRGVVDNPRRPSGGLYPTPFFPIVADAVTLLCRIKKQGGDWVRHYAILDGDVPLELAEGQAQWMGVQEYRRRLEMAGLTPAVAEVLALEQGDTDKLTEYSPRQLLDLVFQVFGDKDVLDNYQRARDEQRATELELESLSRQEEALQTRVETMKTRANRYLEWRQLQTGIARLRDEALPVLAYLDAKSALGNVWKNYRGNFHTLNQAQGEHADTLQLVAKLKAAEVAADASRKAAETARVGAQEAFMAAKGEHAGVAGQLKERDRLQALASKEYGADAAQLADKLSALRGEAEQLKDGLRELKKQRQDSSQHLEALEIGRGRAPEDVRQFKAALDEAGIGHLMLSDIVEVMDPDWQAAVEALLRGYRHVVLLERESDRREAWRIGEKLRYRHFVVPERSRPPRANAGSLMEVVRFSADAPEWLYRQLNSVSRVDGAEQGADVCGDWITRDGYFRERRGARHIGVPAHEFAFGEAARQSRLLAVREALKALNTRILADEERLVAATREAAGLAEYLGGMDAIRQLDSRAEEFAALETRKQGLESEIARLGAALGLASAEKEAADQRYSDARLAHDRVCQREQDSLAAFRQKQQEVEQARRQVRRLLSELREWAERLPDAALAPENVEALESEFDTAADAKHQLNYLEERLQSGDWEQDEAVLALKDKLVEDLTGLDRERQRRQSEVDRSRELTDEARAAYMGKLRATVRVYGQNVKCLGELAGIQVEVELPQLSNDDAALAQAGLVLKFNFDQKGLMGMNDGEASGGQQVMKSLILLIGLMMDESNPSGFVFIDEPFAHLDIFNIDRVAGFLKATEAQYLITTPNTHNINIFAPSELTLATRKKRPGEQWAPPILQTRRRADGGEPA
ncbi:chromosome segregation ATPase [Chromobacterium alkanivorans]|uniref:ATP-binding protein n=1 Tax=Chromobacterium alkanivorans TaxID=1071719 RepID=UPI0021691E28|nr:AAA family ATPase [Chromobacterium alkanivorans]MCS3802817.1 chromosome segregation ATPase [Chromobacterium alkanivorans]MCS3817143.1 chromosome segregation ATPase [Chromobacterium alkanivorans]MCS3872183.1 chromosome segregation ATPase [Chromobacterium alkanivorans]